MNYRIYIYGLQRCNTGNFAGLWRGVLTAHHFRAQTYRPCFADSVFVYFKFERFKSNMVDVPDSRDCNGDSVLLFAEKRIKARAWRKKRFEIKQDRLNKRSAEIAQPIDRFDYYQ